MLQMARNAKGSMVNATVTRTQLQPTTKPSNALRKVNLEIRHQAFLLERLLERLELGARAMSLESTGILVTALLNDQYGLSGSQVGSWAYVSSMTKVGVSPLVSRCRW